VVYIAGQTGVIPMFKRYGRVVRLLRTTDERVEILSHICNKSITETLDIMVGKDFSEVERKAPNAIAKAREELKLKYQENNQGTENVRQENSPSSFGI
jgi:hypothetical protein